eukprot:TRINITY_DN11875_c0_g1_i1.p1 TRINITY_DN11875_c0_g1~~TRINITY_DN11875_c0_g1_i1.p1  ORF type:complete len:160 (+),score=21.76 TRINITY_DN11875_c0_g1_i1:57-482(+)
MAVASDEYQRAATTTVVDPLDLLPPDLVPPVVPELAAPSSLKAFVVSRDPKITVIPNFFTKEECDHLLGLAEGYWVPSLVGQATYSSSEEYAKGDLENAISQTRTSWSCMLRYSQTSIVERLEHRLASIAGLPLDLNLALN